MHDEPAQQPSGHVVASQLPVPASGLLVTTQTPFELHCSVGLQALHTAPPVPHDAREVPARQTPLGSRQPSQVPPTHSPLALQVAPDVHATQLYPSEPHALLTLPAWHSPAASMQPRQVGFWHRPLRVQT